MCSRRRGTDDCGPTLTTQRGCVQSTKGYRRLWSYPDDAATVCAVTEGVPTTVVLPRRRSEGVCSRRRGYRRLWSYPDDAARVCAVAEGVPTTLWFYPDDAAGIERMTGTEQPSRSLRVIIMSAAIFIHCNIFTALTRFDRWWKLFAACILPGNCYILYLGAEDCKAYTIIDVGNSLCKRIKGLPRIARDIASR